MDIDQLIGKFDKLMHEHGRWFMLASVFLVAVFLFLLWVFATRRMPEVGSSEAISVLRHLL
ncbi:hypothetical protein A3F27_00180 [Candidatus Kaiserbacteria bacterium RIFCSPHIGHO2_12_FULL_53_13]|uniref:Uncharacterized protein n=1 Tax=Candidatus Kaiserbacteria bacterium RIFCSPHIGHO2_12_FULL_53_13 TaxID=1798502 RepID=A0A1F6ECC8_9BACT|nr:MAG: hypothetical protein A3F27_00180 [Candidatus Kaiserbacteria bacterium RIFCSPHIGHO2_12_FULL_53_13]OGG74309.1 MAG: hypothetical protein A3A37_03245 [Candidatus Kaiserbacteria bacterium RIFCSPLOWO2_01_FULL_52_36]